MVCEKPFTPTFKEADDLVKIATKQNKLLAVYQSMSSYPSQHYLDMDLSDTYSPTIRPPLGRRLRHALQAG